MRNIPTLPPIPAPDSDSRNPVKHTDLNGNSLGPDIIPDSLSPQEDWPKDLEMTPPSSKNPSPSRGLKAFQPSQEELETILDKHAEYYIRETMKFFQENGESPALSRRNSGDLEAKSAINSLTLKQVLSLIPKKKNLINMETAHEPEKSNPGLNRCWGYNQAIDQMTQSAERIWS